MNGQLDTQVMSQSVRIHKVGEPHGHRGYTDQAVQDSNQLRHLGHLYTTGGKQANGTADQQGHEQGHIVICDNTQYRGDQCDRHTDDAIPVTSPGSFLVGKSA